VPSTVVAWLQRQRRTMTEAEARALSDAPAARQGGCKLTLHPERTRIVDGKDANRRRDRPGIRSDFPGFELRARKS